MSILDSIILGIVQGLSEFLPISSTAHMTLTGRALGVITTPESWTAFIAVVQLGTLGAVLAFFRNDIINIIRDFARDNAKRIPFKEQSLHSKTGWYIVAGTIPIAVIGLLAKDFIEGAFTKNLIVISVSLILLGIILEIAERSGKFDRPIENVTLRDSVLIGLAQVMALIPGSSRSGTTITAGLFLGFTREAAARFSFLLSIPAIGASGILEFFTVMNDLDGSGMTHLIVATIVSGISGYLCIALLLKFLRTKTTRIFVFYRCLLGAIILISIALNFIEP